MSEPQIPQFNFSKDTLDYTDDAQLQEDLAKTGGKFFDEPGNVDLTIIAADFHKNKETGSIFCAKDETWINVKLTFQGAGEKTVDHWLQVPTTGRVKYGSSDTLAVYKNFQAFLFAIGEALDMSNLGKLVQKYFTDPGKALVGTKLNADLGYKGPYTAKVEGSDEYCIIVKGKPLEQDGAVVSLPDRAAAAAYGKGVGLDMSFIKIVKFISKKTGKVEQKSPAAKLKKVAGDDW